MVLDVPKSGKLPPSVLRALILDRISRRRSEVLVHAAFGEDSAIIDFGEWACVISTDPITGSREDAGWLAVHVTCNDVVSNGAEPIGVLLTILCPERLGAEYENLPKNPAKDSQELPGHLGLIDSIMRNAERAASELGVEILGGHTEITPGITRPIVSATAIGKAPRNKIITSSGAKTGDLLILTKGAGVEGTAILAADFEDLLKSALPHDLVERAKRFREKISVVREGLIASENGASAMHDVTEGGVLGAVYEMAEASGAGVEVWADKIPVAAETKEICSFFSIDPMRLISSGSMLISAPKSDPILSLLHKEGIEASVIGRVTDKGSVLVKSDKVMDLIPPQSDELWKVITRYSQDDGGS